MLTGICLRTNIFMLHEWGDIMLQTSVNYIRATTWASEFLARINFVHMYWKLSTAVCECIQMTRWIFINIVINVLNGSLKHTWAVKMLIIIINFIDTLISRLWPCSGMFTKILRLKYWLISDLMSVVIQGHMTPVCLWLRLEWLQQSSINLHQTVYL